MGWRDRRLSWARRRHGLGRLLVVVVLVVAVPGVALAFWSGGGTGSGSVKLAHTLGLTLSPGVSSDALAPGDSAGVSVVVSNPNSFVVHVGSLALEAGVSGPITVDAGHGGCDVSALSYTAQTNGTTGWDVPPEVGSTAGVLRVALPDALAMSDAAANACQGATFMIALQATG